MSLPVLDACSLSDLCFENIFYKLWLVFLIVSVMDIHLF